MKWNCRTSCLVEYPLCHGTHYTLESDHGVEMLSLSGPFSNAVCHQLCSVMDATAPRFRRRTSRTVFTAAVVFYDSLGQLMLASLAPLTGLCSGCRANLTSATKKSDTKHRSGVKGAQKKKEKQAVTRFRICGSARQWRACVDYAVFLQLSSLQHRSEVRSPGRLTGWRPSGPQQQSLLLC